MWVKTKTIPEEGMELTIYDETFLLEPFARGIKFHRQDENGWNLLNVIITPKEGMRLSVLPRAYDLPILIQFKQSLDIYPAKEISLFLRSPWKTGIYLESDFGVWELGNIEKRSLKQIWNGDVTASSGLCYYYSSPLVLEYPLQSGELPLIPLTFTNPTGNIQRIHRVVIDENYLAVYQVKQQFVTSAVTASLTKEGWAQITYGKQTTVELQEGNLQFCPSRVVPQVNGVTSPLRKIKNILDIGT